MKISILHRMSSARSWVRTVTGLLLLAAGAFYAQSAQPLASNAVAQIRALMDEKASRSPAQQKLDSQLIYALKLFNNQPVAAGVTLQQVGATTDAQGTLVVDITATVSQTLLDAITQGGGQVVNAFPNFRAIRARVPLALTEVLASRADVKFIQPAVKALTNTGSLVSQGDAAHRADVGRSTFGVTGAGIKVGVLSDSVDYLSNSQGTGDLPPNVVILPGQSGVPGSGEGTAMLEIVHDVAPEAQLYFASGFNGAASFAQNIIDLRAAGCDVIVDDIGYFNESPFQDGIIAQAVNQVTAAGALYFSSAANSGSLKYGTSGTWEGDFVDGGPVAAPVDEKGGVYHSFGANNYNVILQPGFAATLFWSDPLGAASNDYDLFLLSPDGQTVVASSTTTQNGSQDPYEVAPILGPGLRLVVVKASGEARYLHIDTIRGQLQVATAGNTKGHAVATNAFGVAASDASIPFPNPFSSINGVESFSSDGPRRVFYQADGTPITPGDFLSTGGAVRNKPDITAADGVATTVPGFNPFYGTSAAAPHAAAIAALLLSYNHDLSPADVRNLLVNTAIDIEDAGYDINAGSGIIMAYEALAAAPPPAPSARILVVTNYVTGGNGNGLIDFNECNSLDLVLTNAGGADATTVRLTLSTSTPGVAVVQPQVSIPFIPVGGVVSNLVSFQISTTPEFVCGTTIDFTLVAKSDQNTRTNTFQVQTGVIGLPVSFGSLLPVPIPDASPVGASSPLTVTNVTGAIGKVAVALFLQHTFDSDLTLELISPDGTTNLLAAAVGASGDNFGAACSPDSLRTVFDDNAAVSITAGTAPFLGVFQPQSPLSVFKGKSGAAVNGTWQLRVVDNAPLDTGTLNCWSLILYPVDCVDGGGQCPGADLVVSASDYPDPAVVGGNLVYTLAVTNRGPNTAKGTVVTHNLPSTVAFVSATTTRGSVSQSGGIVTASLGNLPIGGTATITITVTPVVAGSISATSTITSTEPEINPADNVVITPTTVLTPSSDLAVSFSAAPNPTTVGGSLTYTATVLNNGPVTASGVVITNTLPASVQVTGASSSQGSVTIAGNTVICLVGSLTNTATVTANITVVPLSAGTIFATARVVGNQVDPVLANNVVTIATGVGEAADLAITIEDQPDPIVLNSNVTYLVTVTNRGPNVATAVVVNQSLPATFTLVSSNVSQGSVTAGSATAVWNVGSLPVGGTATMTLVGQGTSVGTLITSASVNGEQADSNPADNTAAASTLVATPFVSIVGAGATLTSESVLPPNGALDIGETVAIDFRLRNAGNIPNTNVVATLLATGGVTAPSGPQTYGQLSPGGLPVAKTFTFTASGASGGSVTATLQISDGGNILSNVVFTFGLPRQLVFTNPAAITIPDSGLASPYPSTLVVAGVTGTVGQVTATLSNLNHTFPPDVDVLLVGPTGQKVILMSAAGGAHPVSNTTVTFSDTAAQPVPDADQILTGSYQPASYNPSPAFPSPAPVAPYSSGLSAFANLSPNGTWSLYLLDRNSGDAGSVASGWRLALNLISPVNSIGDLAVAGTVTPAEGLVGNNLTWTLTVTNRGPGLQNGVVLTNTLSAGLVLQSASASLGVLSTNGNRVVCSFGSLASNATATVTLVAKPTAAGAASVTATVAGSEIDLNTANNTAVVAAVNSLPLANVEIGATAAPVPAIVGSNLTYIIAVTNHGPGNALGTVVTAPVPVGTSYQSATVSKGSFTPAGGSVGYAFGDLLPNETVSATLVVTPLNAGQLTNTISVATVSNDTNATDNVATVTLAVNAPRAIVVAAGAKAVAESQSPLNGALDAGETVTLALALANQGQLPTINLAASLQASGGVSAPSGTQNYGALPPNGLPAAREFTFTVPNAPGATVTATLDLTDDGSPIGSVSFVFLVSSGTSYTNALPIIIPDRGIAAPYPSVITVAGVTGQVGGVTVKLNGFTHSFPADVDALLVGPQGQKLMLVSDAGGGFSVTNLALTFNDGAASSLPTASALATGTFRPTDYEPGDVMPAPAPAGASSAQLAAFNGTDPNGNWSLYVADDSNGDAGAINGGWELNLILVQPVSPLANVGIVAAGGTPTSLFTDEFVTYAIQVTNRGPGEASGVLVTDSLPPGALFDSATSSQGSFTSGAGTVTFNLGSLAAGAGADLTVRVRPTLAGNLTSFISVISDQTDVDLLDNSASVATLVLTPEPAQLTGAYETTNQTFQITLTGQAGLTYVLQASADLTAWTPISTNTAPESGVIKITDSDASGYVHRFYRAVRVTP